MSLVKTRLLERGEGFLETTFSYGSGSVPVCGCVGVYVIWMCVYVCGFICVCVFVCECIRTCACVCVCCSQVAK